MMLVILCFGFLFSILLIATAFFLQTRERIWVQNDRETFDCANEHPLRDTTPVTAIVGAGVVGLCTAYHLARAIHRHVGPHLHKVIVVEAAEREFAATSGSSTGILTDSSTNNDLLDLTRYSYEEWALLGNETEFSKACGYKEGVNYSLKPGSGIGQNLIPDWVRAEADWDAMRDPNHGKLAIINPVALGNWLYQECLRYGVEFRMGFQAVGANVSRSNHLVSLDLADYGQKRTTVRLDNLVLAAGPWTPALFQMLFPASSIDLEPVTDASDWIVFENPKPMSAKTIGAVYLDDIVGEKLEFAGRNDHTIWATGKRSHAGVVPTVGRTPEVDQASLDELHADAEVFLKHGQGEDRELHVLSQGRSYRPTTQTGMPIIAGVPADRLSVNSSIWPLETTKKSVYVNFGHGSHGILLGMGSGKLMSQIIRGEKTDINVSKMGFS